MSSANQSEDTQLLFVLSGLKLSAEMKDQIEKKMKSVLLQELAAIDNTGQFIATPLKDLPAERQKILAIPEAVRSGSAFPFPVGTSGLRIELKTAR